MEKKRLLVIDSNSVLHRAYHALPPLTDREGELINAVYGFLLVFLKIIKEFRPDFIAAAFDYPAPTFRHRMYKKYKAMRPPTPKGLSRQIPKFKEVLNKFNVPIYEKKDFEADDIIGTIARLAPRKFISYSRKTSGPGETGPKIEIIILSGDLDTLQLVDSYTRVYILRKGVKDTILYNKELVQRKFHGLIPEQILDFKALRGDPSDNIPGVVGIGEKRAIELLLRFGSLDNLYKELKKESEEIKRLKPKLRNALLRYEKQAFLSKELAKIKKDVPINFNLKKCQWKKYNKKRMVKIFESLGFHSLINRLPSTDEESAGGGGGPARLQTVGKIGENLKLW